VRAPDYKSAAVDHYSPAIWSYIMVSRIQISLQSLFNSTTIEVVLRTERGDPPNDNDPRFQQQVAVVKFASTRSEFSNGPGYYEHTFDLSSHAGVINLAADFNFFRDVERHTCLMRALLEHSISFEVLVG
jgi:hypothetical protein